MLRLVPALAHLLLVFAVAQLAELLEEGAGPIAALAVLFAPMYAGLYSLLGTTVFEPLAWTLIATCALRALRGEPRFWMRAGAVAGIALEAKYTLPFFAAPLLMGVLLEKDRRALFTRQAALGLGLAVAIALPSAIWQWSHGLPFLDLMRAAKEKNDIAAPGSFLLGQITAMNPLLAPLWICGLVYGFRRARFLAVAFLGVLLEMLLLHGKDYYVAPAYGVAFALGAAAMVRWVRPLAARAVWLAAAGILAVVAAPLSLPIVAPHSLERYAAALGQGPNPQEKAQHGVLIPPHLADMLGWPELAQQVAAAWYTLPPAERSKAAIFTSNYGEAAAIDFFAEGLPRARSGHNQYWLWGKDQPDAGTLIALASPAGARKRCAEVREVGRVGVPYAMPYEQRPILACRGHPPLPELWPALRHYE